MSVAMTTTARLALAEKLAATLGIAVVNEKVDEATVDGEFVSLWPGGFVRREENSQYRTFVVNGRVFLPKVPGTGQDDPAALEWAAESLVEALASIGATLTEDAWFVELQGVDFDLDTGVVEFAVSIELPNPGEV